MGSCWKGTLNTAPSNFRRVRWLMSYSLMSQKCLVGTGRAVVGYQLTACQLQIHPPAHAMQWWMCSLKPFFPVSAMQKFPSAGPQRNLQEPGASLLWGQHVAWGPLGRTLATEREEKGQPPSNPAALAWSRVGFQWPCQHTPCGPPAACHAPTPVSMVFSPWCGRGLPDGDATCSVPTALTLPLCAPACLAISSSSHREGCHQGPPLLCARVMGYW